MYENRPDAERERTRRFEEIFLPHLGASFHLARWLLQNDEDAQDAVQDAYLRACKSFSTFRGGDGRAWLLSIVRNVCYSQIRKNRRQGLECAFDEELHGIDEEPAEVRLRQQASEERLNLALGNLPAEFREILVMHELSGLSYKEIAAVADIPMGTVMSRLARARKRLQVELLRPAAPDTIPKKP